MKTFISAAILILVAPLAAIGLLAGANAASTSLGGDCPTGPIVNAAVQSDSPPSATDSGGPCAPAGRQSPASAFHGPDGLVDDPTTSGRITRRMLHTYNEVQRVFGSRKWGISCWDPHLWNPTSDHPLGRACDFTVGHIGTRPTTAQRASGWQLAHWAQANANTLGISYIIFDDHIWSLIRSNDGWRHYDGGGVYDPTSVTGGHFDHVHISVLANSA